MPQRIKHTHSGKYSWVWDIPKSKLPKRAEELWPTKNPDKSETAKQPSKAAERDLGKNRLLGQSC